MSPGGARDRPIKNVACRIRNKFWLKMTVCPPHTRDDLFAFLDHLKIPHRTLEHQAAHTVEQAREHRGALPGGHAKNLFLKCKKGSLWLVIAQETTPIRLNQLHKQLGCGRLSFGSPELMFEVLGVHPGSVTPFALLNDQQQKVNLVLDERLMQQDPLNFHPLQNTATTTISSHDLLVFISACGFTPQIMALPLLEK